MLQPNFKSWRLLKENALLQGRELGCYTINTYNVDNDMIEELWYNFLDLHRKGKATFCSKNTDFPQI